MTDIIADVDYDALGRRKTMLLGNLTTRTFSYEDEQAGGSNLNRALWKDEITVSARRSPCFASS